MVKMAGIGYLMKYINFGFRLQPGGCLVTATVAEARPSAAQWMDPTYCKA